ncbi:CUE domain-containing protein [Aphelenchoides fujianensis]|nr:CUE domain-containing protein [Aphelenchoides fujianensis]
MTTAELTHEQRVQRANELRSRVMLGRLSDDFLRLPSSSNAPNQLNPLVQQQLAALDPATQFYAFVPPNTRGRLVVKVVEARLAKNYGLMRMDPYVRIRIGSSVFESHTCVSAGKTPVWNRVINSYLPNGVESVYVQVFDERSFTQDEVVAWTHTKLPEGIFRGETIDEWYPLSGALGDKAGGPVNQSSTPGGQNAPATVAEPQAVVNVQPTAREPAAPVVNEADVLEVAEMFPNVEPEVIRSVLEAKRGDKTEAVNALVEMA